MVNAGVVSGTNLNLNVCMVVPNVCIIDPDV